MAKRLMGKSMPKAAQPASDGGDGGASSAFSLAFNTAPVPGKPSQMYVDIAVRPPAGESRRPCDVVCVVDVSGSMSSLASIPDDKGESDNLTRLDLVKHSVRTIIASLKPQDRLAVVSFSSDTKVRVPLTPMDPAHQKTATAAVNAMETEGCTNMWDGIEKGLDLAIGADDAGNPQQTRTRSVFLLTDGEPSDSQHLDKLDRYIKAQDALQQQVTLSTFGFGYSLKSELLDDIASACGGMYTFVPDASIVGTAFVSSLSNALATMQQGVQVTLQGAQLVSVLGRYPVIALQAGEFADHPGDGGATVHIGSLLYGQPRNVVVVIDTAGCEASPEIISASVVTRDHPTQTIALRTRDAGEPAAAMEQAHRLQFGTALLDPRTGGARRAMQEQARALEEAIKASPAKGNANTKALLEDVVGQVKEALSKDEWFNKWGGHYLPSLCRSHMLQQCSNFKDPGLQVYGGAIFQDARAEADDIFVSLPAPTPTGRSGRGGRGGGGGGGARAAPVSMARYYNAGGGCFLGSCTVRMAPAADGGAGGDKHAVRSVRSIRKGDRIATAGGGAATVLCVVQTDTEDGEAEMVSLPGGLVITPYHPVRDPATGKWAFPIDLAPAAPVACSSYYTFVLDTGHTAFISGVECVGLGHGLDEDVVRHAYLGSRRVVDDLARSAGWARGRVILKQRSYIRDPATMQVVGLATTEAGKAGDGADAAAIERALRGERYSAQWCRPLAPAAVDAAARMVQA